VRDLAVRAEQIRVGGNLGGALAPLHDISLDVIDTPANHADFIELTGAGSQAIVATGQLSLNGDGRAATPVEATIFKRSGDLSLSGATVLFGPREKATVIGNLTISGGTISLSDLTALTLGVSATGTLFLQTRDPAPTATGVGPDAAPDAGMDLVANAIAINAAAIALVPVDAGAPSVVKLGTVDASNALVNGAAPGNPFAPVAIFSNVAQPIAAADLVGTVTGAGANTVLDLKAEGPARGSQRPPPSPVFLLIAKPTGGMNAAAASEKPLRSSEVTAFLRCDPEDAACQEKAVGAARARSQEAHELRQSYAKLFGASTEASGKPPAETSKEVLQRAVDAYRQNNRTEPTGTAFRQFCETTPELSAAVRVLDDLRSNLRLARAFGRSGEGLGDYKQQALGRMLPEGMTLEGLEAAVEAGETPSAKP
jgi:hypothetical protein